MRAVGYTRVSGASQDKGFGPDVQRERIEEYAREKGIELAGIVHEAAGGGRREEEVFSWEHRPALLGIIERAECGDFDVLIVARYDRLARDYATLIVLERRFQKCGVGVVSVAEEHNGEGALGEFIRGQLALAAELERAIIHERLSAGRAKAKAAGRHTDGPPPYGYLLAGGSLKPEPRAADVVRRIFADAIDGRSAGRIAQELNETGIPTPRGGKGWSRQKIHGILRNPIYVGEMHGVKKAHPSIVSRQVFNRAQAALDTRRKGGRATS